MMKPILALAFLAMLPFQSLAAKWQEGIHFEVVSEQATATPVVTEFFSFWCPACNAIEPMVAELKTKLTKQGAGFEKVHVNYMGFADKETQELLTKGMLLAKSLGREAELNKVVFDHIHKDRKNIEGIADLRKLFVENGVDGTKFDKLIASFGINSQLAKNNKQIDKYRSNLGGVPYFFVNGKYKATVTRDMTPDDVVELISWLATQP
ncbi:thiol:disulfide interchange protein DsbA/DsbL [Aliiglaciecola sp. CAU 1673]|uniref:thiol:disulfide interchange protein DsbA/DsbL n=1 Tax=Aliiglaciecola sp. CAU 1673 TaxID=3032595 RepID=UPI0023DBFB6C|nr:thiol:disulfide interchange protein DsbA/DsbL [Aliiglaciecola sp. CAU 1673]MDF2179062.1 thiol:disulfide interchange protein DsbA/DsbL [Aliiglaciecola sp. CAU 1673]